MGATATRRRAGALTQASSLGWRSLVLKNTSMAVLAATILLLASGCATSDTDASPAQPTGSSARP